MSETVLVTGSSGFVGSYIIRDLAEAGHRIVGIDLVEPGPASAWIQSPVRDSMTFVPGTVEQWGPLAGAIVRHRPTAIVHAAALVRPDLLERQPFTALRANVESSLNVFEAARVFGISRVVYLSSIGVIPVALYRPIDANHPIITATQGTPDTFYGAAKIASEAFAFAYHHALGLDVLIVRPSAVYGFGMQWPIHVRPMVENAIRGEPTRFPTGGDMLRDYTHAADVAQMIRRCIEIPAERVVDRVFYCGTGRDPVTISRVAEIVRELVPGADIEVGPGLADDEVRDAATRAAFDMTAAREQLGFAPRFTDIRDGLADYIEQASRFDADAERRGT